MSDTASVATKRVWTWERENGRSKGWACRFRFGRLQLGGTIIRHRYATSSDRWVIHPKMIYDRAH